MKVLIVLSAVVAVSLAGYLPGGLHGFTSYSAPIAAPHAYSAAVAPAFLSRQHHAQDALGQYSYGYTDGLSAKGEVKTADGVTRGGYSYLDAEGKVQNVAYTADAVNGFRVAASNLPKAPAVPETPALEAPKPVEDTVEVAAAKSAHQAAINEAKSRAAAAPVPVASAPAVVATRGLIGTPAGILSVAPSRAFAYSSVAAAPALSYSSIAAPTFGYSSISGPTFGYSSNAAPALGYSSNAAPALGYSSNAAPAPLGYSSIAAPALSYSGLAAPALSYSGLAAPALSYSGLAAPTLSYSSIAAPTVKVSAPAAPVVLTAQGVPVDTPEVQAARAADQVAHLRAKGLIY